MDSNTHSTQSPGPSRPGTRDDVAALTAVLDRLTARDLDRLSDGVRAERVLALRRLVERLDGQWLKELAGVDARGAAGAEDGLQVGLDRRLAPQPAPPERPRGHGRSGPPGPCSGDR